MGRKTRTAVVTVAVLALGGGALLYSLDRIVRTAVERAGILALGVGVTLEEVDLRLLAGDLRLRGLRVANPEGFADEAFLTLGRAHVALDLASLLKPTVVVDELALEDLDLRLEQRGRRSNYGAILAHLNRLSGGKGGKAASAQAPRQGKGFRVRRLTIAGVKAHVRVAAPAGASREFGVEVPPIELRNVGSDKKAGIGLPQLAGVVVGAVLRSVARRGGGLPRVLARDLSGQLERWVPTGGGGAWGPTVEGVEGEAAARARKALESLSGKTQRGGSP